MENLPNGPTRFECSCCGEIHDDSFSFGFAAPDPYLEQPEEIRNQGSLGGDLCRYEDEDGPHYFIRVCLEVPIEGLDEPFLWGVWVSVSRQSYDLYVETYDDPDPAVSYFGWFCNYLPFYANTFGLKTEVIPRSDGTRPRLVLERTEHPLSVDFHGGISVERARKIAEAALHG